MTADDLAKAQAELAQAKAELDWNVRKIAADMARSLLVEPSDLSGLMLDDAPTTPDGVYVITTLEAP